jgi:hypothetical protein
MVQLQVHAVVAIGHIPLCRVDGPVLGVCLVDGEEDSVQHPPKLHGLWQSQW